MQQLKEMQCERGKKSAGVQSKHQPVLITLSDNLQKTQNEVSYYCGF